LKPTVVRRLAMEGREKGFMGRLVTGRTVRPRRERRRKSSSPSAQELGICFIPDLTLFDLLGKSLFIWVVELAMESGKIGGLHATVSHLMGLVGFHS